MTSYVDRGKAWRSPKEKLITHLQTQLGMSRQESRQLVERALFPTIPSIQSIRKAKGAFIEGANLDVFGYPSFDKIPSMF